MGKFENKTPSRPSAPSRGGRGAPRGGSFGGRGGRGAPRGGAPKNKTTIVPHRYAGVFIA